MKHPATSVPPSDPPAYWVLVDRGEPFRLLFPVGTALGILGVLLWPAFIWGGAPYPLHSHPAIMIQGFLLSFVIGFLGTALPRLLSVRKLRLPETLAYAGGTILISCLHLLGWHTLGNAFFVFLLIAFLFGLLRRAREREDIPPPGFVLVALGMLCGLTGGLLTALDTLRPGILPGNMPLLANILWQQGFLLLPILGIGAFLLPRFFGLQSQQDFPESLRPTPEWIKVAIFAGLCGVAILGSFVLEATGWWRTGFLLRAFTIFVYFFREVPVHRARFGRGSLAWSLRIALASIPLGYLLMAAFPAWQITIVHIVFISGFSLLTFTVATRVVLGHSGQDSKFELPLKSVMTVTVLLVLAVVIRIAADFIPDLRLSHYAYASLLWVGGAIVWSACMLPGVRFPDRD